MADYDVQLLAELIDEACRPTPIRKLPSRKRKQYHANAVVRTRGNVVAALAEGIVPVNRQHIRDALCDAAIHILASGGDGAQTIHRVLAAVFSHDLEAPQTVVRKVEAGKIVPKFYKSA